MTRRNSVFSIVRCKGGLAFAANLRHGRRDGTEQVETGIIQGDELKPLDEEGKRLYQRIVAKLKYLAHVCNFMSCKCCLVALPWGRAGETSWALLEESARCLAGFLL